LKAIDSIRVSEELNDDTIKKILLSDY